MSTRSTGALTNGWLESLALTHRREPTRTNDSPPSYMRSSANSDHNNQARRPAPRLMLPPPNQMLLFVFGATGAGKTTLINNITGSSLEVGLSLESCTRDIQGSAMEYKGRQVIVYDTPGFDDSEFTDTAILKQIATFLSTSHDLGTGRASGIIFVHDINNPRVSGTSLKNLRMFKGLVGDETLKNVVFVTNKWSSPPTPEHEARQRELETTDKYFGNAIKQGARVFRGGRDVTQADVTELLDMFLQCDPSSFQIQKEMAEGKDLASTAAGKELGRELLLLQQKHREEVAELRKFMEDAQHRDRALFEELRAEKEAAERMAGEAELRQEELMSTLQAERQELAARMRAMQAMQGMHDGRQMVYQNSSSTLGKKVGKVAMTSLKVVGVASSVALAFLGLPIGFGF